ncbi:MAG TPA: hypothetical protein PLD84_06970 [Chitinophagales bacterium]|nr:hypothetical protein [Chitinophagales bacterium]
MLTKKRLPLLIALICCVEVSIYLWAVWTSTFDATNFFAVQPAFVYDKCARLSGRISAFLILITLSMVGYYGLKNIYAHDKKRNSFRVLITLFTFNHLIHLLFVILRFRSHDELLTLDGPVHIGGTVHGFITFIFLIIIPFILWNYQNLNKVLYFVIILHLFNISGFIIKTFLGKVKPPDHPAYHNQFGVAVITAACVYILYRVYIENKRNPKTYDQH